MKRLIKQALGKLSPTTLISMGVRAKIRGDNSQADWALFEVINEKGQTKHFYETLEQNKVEGRLYIGE